MIAPWKILSSTKDLSLRIFDLTINQAISPRTGKTHKFYILESSAWVNIIPLTPKQEVVMVRQFRHGIQANTLEIPGGLVENKDTPQQAALRELREETGYSGQKIEFLGKVHPNPAFLNNECYTYLINDVQHLYAQDLDPKEDIEVELHSLDQISEMIKTGVISHSLVIAAFAFYFLRYPNQ